MVRPYFGKNEHDTKKITCPVLEEKNSLDLSTGTLANTIYLYGFSVEVGGAEPYFFILFSRRSAMSLVTSVTEKYRSTRVIMSAKSDGDGGTK